MKAYIVFVFTLIGISVSFSCIAQLDFTLGGGPHHLGIGRASVSATSTSAIFNNPATLAFKDGYGIQANALRRYNISGLDLYGIGLVYAKNNQSFSLNLNQYGFDTYREQKLGIAYSRKLIENIAVSLQFDYLNLSIQEFGSQSLLAFEIGFISKVADKVWLGAHIFSPEGSSISADYNLNTRFRIGPRIAVSRNLNLFLELEKSLDFDAVLKAGIEYGLNEQFNILVGAIPSLSEFSFGFGYTFDKTYTAHGAFTYDDTLDISPSVGLTYFKEND